MALIRKLMARKQRSNHLLTAALLMMTLSPTTTIALATLATLATLALILTTVPATMTAPVTTAPATTALATTAQATLLLIRHLTRAPQVMTQAALALQMTSQWLILANKFNQRLQSPPSKSVKINQHHPQ